MIADIKIYYSSNIVNCPFCKMAKEYFDSEGLEYFEIDIAKDQEVRDKLIAITKKDAFPQIKINNYYLVGFKRVVVKALIDKIKAQGNPEDVPSVKRNVNKENK